MPAQPPSSDPPAGENPEAQADVVTPDDADAGDVAAGGAGANRGRAAVSDEPSAVEENGRSSSERDEASSTD